MQTEPSKTDPPKRRGRRFQFSLRTLILSTAVLGAAGGWLGKLNKLETLDLSSACITDDGLRHVANLRNLRSLSIRNQATTYAANHPQSTRTYYYSTLDLKGNDLIIHALPSGVVVTRSIAR